MDASLSPPATPTIRLDAAGEARPATDRPTDAGGVGNHRADAEAGPAPASAHADADERRFEALYARHARAVLAYAGRRTDPQTAQDVLAETFLVAWRRRGDVPDDALPWLYAVAGNALHNQRRSARRQVAVGERLAAEPVPPVGTAGAAEGRTGEDVGLLRALATLRPIDREALLLTAWEDLDPGRAARAAGCSRATFNVRLHRARRRLARALQAQAGDAPVAPSPTPSSDPERTASA